MPDGLTPQQLQMLKLLRAADAKGTTISTMADKLGTTPHTVKQAVYNLRQKGVRIARRDVLVLVKENESEEDQGQ